MNIISLFDGMSCAMIAFDRLGIKPDNYFAGKLSSRQEAVKSVLERLGFEVWVVNEYNIDDYIKKI